MAGKKRVNAIAEWLRIPYSDRTVLATGGGDVQTQPNGNNHHGHGPLLAIGGAEDKVRDRLILRRFIELAGGSKARVAIVPTASSLPQAGDRYASIFAELGAESSIIQVKSREQAMDRSIADDVLSSTAIFITGGNQIRVASVLGGTAVGNAIVHASRTGTLIGGTSAGASVMSAVMVAGGGRDRTPRAQSAVMAPGLGLVDSLVIDQHFRERDRVARLVTMVSYNPGLLGLGIDEDTAALIGSDDRIDVLGAGSVTIVDGSEMTSNVHSRHEGIPLTVTNAVIHFLTSGSRYDITDREVLPVRR